jgi:hypothetical protein
MSYTEMAAEILDGTGWDVEDDTCLICPCGNTIEYDGRCPECGPSPFITLGMI